MYHLGVTDNLEYVLGKMDIRNTEFVLDFLYYQICSPGKKLSQDMVGKILSRFVAGGYVPQYSEHPKTYTDKKEFGDFLIGNALNELQKKGEISNIQNGYGHFWRLWKNSFSGKEIWSVEKVQEYVKGYLPAILGKKDN